MASLEIGADELRLELQAAVQALSALAARYLCWLMIQWVDSKENLNPETRVIFP